MHCIQLLYMCTLFSCIAMILNFMLCKAKAHPLYVLHYPTILLFNDVSSCGPFIACGENRGRKRCSVVSRVVMNSKVWQDFLFIHAPNHRYNNRTYRIDEIDWDKNPQCTFLNHQGESITFIDYYK